MKEGLPLPNSERVPPPRPREGDSREVVEGEVDVEAEGLTVATPVPKGIEDCREDRVNEGELLPVGEALSVTAPLEEEGRRGEGVVVGVGSKGDPLLVRLVEGQGEEDRVTPWGVGVTVDVVVAAPAPNPWGVGVGRVEGVAWADAEGVVVCRRGGDWVPALEEVGKALEGDTEPEGEGLKVSGEGEGEPDGEGDSVATEDWEGDREPREELDGEWESRAVGEVEGESVGSPEAVLMAVGEEDALASRVVSEEAVGVGYWVCAGAHD